MSVQENTTVRKSRLGFGGFVALALALVALAVPALAAAQEYTVNVRSINPDPSGCENPGVGTECTLPGAIEAANVHAGGDLINFDTTVFQGAAPFATITLASALPAITEEVEILGGHCTTGWLLAGPCVELTLSATASTSILTVSASGVTVEGLAFEGAGNGILVGEGATGFSATNDWFGIGLNRGGGAVEAGAGILLGPAADDATIGGTAPGARNVFSRAAIGVYAHGASDASIEGNYFGLNPEGQFSLGSSLGEGVRIENFKGTPSSAAEGDEIGGVLGATEAGTAACDGPCNVFAVEPDGTDIDLTGTGLPGGEPAAGPTVIRGNYLGLSPGGGESIGRAEVGVYADRLNAAPGPGEVTIGGEDTATEGNFFDGGEHNAVESEGATGLGVIGNEFGYTFGPVADTAARNASVYLDSEGAAEGARVSSNQIFGGNNGTGVETINAGSEIVGNEILGGLFGVFAMKDSEGVGNLIQANTITESSQDGVKIENDLNTVRGNTIAKSEGAGIELEGEGYELLEMSESNAVIGNTVTEAAEVGIYVGSNATRNRIGGDAAGEVNTIVGSGENEEREGAIVISGRQTGRTEVAANTGFGNYGPFIQLYSHGGAEEPNGGIQPPALSTVLQSSAAGTASPNATVRIFSKASAEAGELGTLLAVTKAGATGTWSATYATQPTGTLITATQTTEAGLPEAATSELAAPTAAAAASAKPQEAKITPVTTLPPPSTLPLPAKPKPKVKITKGPKKSSTATKATFKFKATNVSGAKFECKFDSSKWASCKSPKTYTKLKPGKHTFQVRAKAKGVTGAAAKFSFTVKP